jgi:hypothetical protein
MRFPRRWALADITVVSLSNGSELRIAAFDVFFGRVRLSILA